MPLWNASASITAAQVETAASDALAAAWGDVIRIGAFYAVGTSEVIPAPGAGFRLEILSWRAVSFNVVASVGYNFTWGSGANDNLDDDGGGNTYTVSGGSEVTDATPDPFTPTYTLLENTNFRIVCGADELVVGVRYRIVPV